jgi:hypothetical protein
MRRIENREAKSHALIIMDGQSTFRETGGQLFRVLIRNKSEYNTKVLHLVLHLS